MKNIELPHIEFRVPAQFPAATPRLRLALALLPRPRPAAFAARCLWEVAVSTRWTLLIGKNRRQGEPGVSGLFLNNHVVLVVGEGAGSGSGSSNPVLRAFKLEADTQGAITACSWRQERCFWQKTAELQISGP